jgi:hypothetical protein
MSDRSKDDAQDLLDGTDPLDDPVIEARLEPKHLDEALERAAHDAEESGEGGLIDPDLVPDS